MKFYLFFISLFIYNCSTTNSSSAKEEQPSLKYLALGDSYTIGESVTEQQRWPTLIHQSIRKAGYSIHAPKIIAKTGWRTDNLLHAIKMQLDTSEKYDLVSVLIGVNNQFQSASITSYEEDLRKLFDQAISYCKTGKKGVFVLSIPDYGATPYGASRASTIGEAIDQWNAVYKKVTLEYGLSWYNITPISRKATTDRSLVANDGLHPSGKMYQQWVDFIGPNVLNLLP